MTPFSPGASLRLYRALLWLYPPAFRREFGGDMTRDFADTLEDARARGARGTLAMLWAGAARDLAWSVPRQWLRTGVLAIAGTAALATTVCLGAASLILTPGGLPASSTPAHEEDIIVLLIVVVALVPVGGVILFTTCFLGPTLRRRPPRRA